MTIRTRLFSLLMAVVMVFSLMPTTALAADEHVHDGEVPAAVIGEAVEAPSAEDMAASAPYIDGTYIYANGNNLTIEAGSAGYTKIKYGSSYLSFAGSGFAIGANANEADLSEATIYGGSTVTVNGGTVKELIGGDLNNTNGDVSITVNGGTVTNLYGGDNVSGNVNLTVNGGKVNYAYAVHEDGEIGGNFYVRVTDGGEIGWIHSYGIYNYNGNTSYSNEKMYVKAESGSAVERVYLPTDADSAFGAVLCLACQTELWTTSAFVSPSRWYDIKDEDKNAILARLEHTMWVTRNYEWWLLKGTIDGACQNEAFVIQKGESYSSDGNPASSKTITNYGTFTVSAWDDGNVQNHIVNYGTLILEDGCPLVQTVDNHGTMVMNMNTRAANVANYGTLKWYIADEGHRAVITNLTGNGTVEALCTHKNGNSKEATCTQKAICVDCGLPYGGVNSGNHAGNINKTWTPYKVLNWDIHHLLCSECGGTVDQGDHIGGEANCTEQAKCTVCGGAYGDLNPSKHKGGEANCKEQAKCELCGVAYGDLNPSNHSGGEANCKEQAKCERCGVAYGDLNPSNHKGGEATCTKLAKCELCDKEYGELKAHETTAKATCTTPAQCSVCGDYGQINSDNHVKPNEFTYAVNKSDSTKHDKQYACCNAVAATEDHTPEADDGICTTAVSCTACEAVTTAAKAEHTRGEDDSDCTTALSCAVEGCNYIFVEAKTEHSPAEDDGSCMTEIVCKNEGCTVVTTPAQKAHAFADRVCKNCGLVGGYCGSEENEGGRQSLLWTYADGTLTISGAGDMAERMYADESGWVNLSDPITALVIDKGVTAISGNAFVNLTKLQSVSFAEGSLLTTIGNGAFASCSSLREITIPAGVTHIDTSHPFDNCDAMVNVRVEQGNTVYKSVDGVLYTADGTTLLYYPHGQIDPGFTFIPPKGVTTIGNSAFASTQVKSVELTNDLTTVGENAFDNCTKLEYITISNSVKGIDPSAFWRCKALEKVNAPCGWRDNPLYNFENKEFIENNNDINVEFADHKYDAWVPNEDGLTHSSACGGCGHVGTGRSYHSTTAEGDKAATCTTQAYCSVCDGYYGETSKTDHDESVVYTEADNGFCPNCGAYQSAVLNDDGVYEISNAGQLYHFAAQVNAGQTTINGKLTANIVVNGNVLDSNGSPNDGEFREWTPIGNNDDRYQGTFDGNGKTVSGLYFNNEGSEYVGLFGYVWSGTVKNVGIVDSYFCGKSHVGGVVGFMDGSITDCYNSGTVSGIDNVGGVVGSNIEYVINCNNSGKVSGINNVGGVVGYNESNVTNCYNTDKVSGSEYVGGVVGNSIGNATNCYNTGAVSGSEYVGGVAGNSRFDVTDCYNSGAVSGTNNVGGVVGYTYANGTIANCHNTGTVSGGGDCVGGIVGQNLAAIINCYNGGKVDGSGINNVGGIVGLNYFAPLTNCYNSGKISGSNYVGGVVGYNYDASVTNCYYLTGTANGGIEGADAAGQAEAKTAAQFKSGEVAYLLGEAFGQSINTEIYPVLGGVKVYAGYNACEDEEKSYSNSEFTKTIPGHEWSYSDDVDGKHSITCKFCEDTETEAHTLIYSASGTTITAACSANCGHRATATISAENATYNGYEQKTATVTYSDNWAGVTFEPTYENNIKVGTASATITVDEAAASASFTIGKKELTLKLTDCSKEYDGTNVLTNFHAEVDGFIFYDEGEYVSSVLDYDDVYDDVSVDATKLVVTLPDSDVGEYDTANVSGITLIGEDAANYTIAAEIDGVLLENDYHNFEISPMSVYITILDQVIGEGQDIDPNAYYLDKEMPEGHTLTGVQLVVDEEAKEIYVATDEDGNIVGLKVTNAKGEDVTHCFDFSVYVTGWLTRTHEGHTFNEDGFCATGQCNEYMPAVARDMIDKDGIERNCYMISNAGQLYWYAQQMEMNSWYEGYAELTKDITIPATAPNWEPINASYAYFNGNYHTISGLKCIGTDYVGMFGNMWYCEVSNLHITNSYFEGGNNVGAVIGDMSNGGIVINCYVTDTTVEGSGNAGGLIGNNGGSVTNCYTTASALVGHSSGSIENCYYLSETDTEDGGKTEAQFKSGEVAYLLGDAFGQTIGTEDYPVFGGTKVYEVVNCKNDFVKYSNTDEIIGHDWSNGDGKCTVCGTPCEHEFVDSKCTVCGFECKDHGTYINGCCIICGAPCEHESYTDGKCDDCGAACTHESYTKGFCTVCDAYEPAVLVDGYYQISNAGQLYWFAKQVNEVDTAINGKLMGNIVVNENVLKADGSPNNGEFRSWTPIGNDGNRYQGTFDGNGKTVSGLYFNSSGTDHVGLFGFVSNGTIKNVGIVDSYFGGTSFIGGVVGFNRGTVTDCYNSGTVSGKGHSVGGVVGNTIGTVTNCYNSGTVSGEVHSVGGVVGYNNSGTVTKCYNTGTVSGNSKCNYVGGVAGYNSRGFVTNCHNSGTVSGNDSVGGVVGDNKGTVKNSYNIGTVSGNNSVGGVVGYNNTGTVTNCYYLTGIANGGIEGADAAGKAEEKSAEQFKSGEVAYLLGDAFGQTIGTDAYPVLGGVKVYSVTNCKNEAVYSNTNEAIVHNWANGVCTVCGTAAPFAFYGSNVTLGNALDLNFAVEKALLPEGAYGMINGTKVKWTYQKQPDGTELMLLTYSGLAAKEMGTVVTATVYDKDGKLLGTREDSIMSYAMRSLENPNFPKNAKPLLIKMLDYGAAAQMEFAYNTNSLVNAGITEAMRTAYPTTSRTSDILNPAIGDLYMGTSLILENAIEMQMGFKGTPEGITATVSYTDHYGKAQTYENADLQAYKDKNTNEVVAYGVVIPGIVVADGRQAVTVTVCKDGKELIKVTDSIASYVARNKSTGVYGAIMGFSDAAHAYLHTKGA